MLSDVPWAATALVKATMAALSGAAHTPGNSRVTDPVRIGVATRASKLELGQTQLFPDRHSDDREDRPDRETGGESGGADHKSPRLFAHAAFGFLHGSLPHVTFDLRDETL